MIGAVEVGGTKILCAIGSTPGEILYGPLISIPTEVGPEAAIAEIVEFFSQSPIDGIGVASFGPLDLDNGTILSSPKTAWVGLSWPQAFRRPFPEIPVAVDTDVNGAVLAEATFGSGIDESVVAYLTVGTGIGGGVSINGEPLHDFRTGVPLFILDDVRIEYLENDVPKWMMSVDMTFSLTLSTHIDSEESYLDVNITLVPGSARCHVMKDEQGIGMFDHSNFVQSFVAALAGLLPSDAGADLMFSIDMEDYGLALSEVAGTSGSGRYFIKLVATKSDLTKILKHVHTGN